MAKRKGYLLSIEGRHIGFKGTDAKVLTPEIAAELPSQWSDASGIQSPSAGPKTRNRYRIRCSGSSATSMSVRSMGWTRGKASH